WTFRRDKARIRHELSRVYDLFPMMQERRKSKAGNLSGGMQKILEVARGMMIRPEILICDEPTVGLAPIIAKEVYDTIERLKADGLTILLVDQNVREAIRIGDQIYVLEVGQNKMNGTRAEFEANQHDMIKDWLQI
ncbi:MAG TPA: ATP-binding cassette domain-containing protein, partial [Gammaproteobacteria bacterium]|nr:ATP-binding cassette domain-containing protein [Gammaproteobacteria bacterium]